MLSNKSQVRRIELYLFWLRYKDLFLFSPIIIIITIFLSITMFERFDRLENNLEQSSESVIQKSYLKNP